MKRLLPVVVLVSLSLAPAARAELFGKLGLTAWDAESSLTPVAPGSLSSRRETSGVDLTWGFGFAYDFTERWGVRLELEYFNLDNEDVRFGSVGIRYTF